MARRQKKIESRKKQRQFVSFPYDLIHASMPCNDRRAITFFHLSKFWYLFYLFLSSIFNKATISITWICERENVCRNRYILMNGFCCCFFFFLSFFSFVSESEKKTTNLMGFQKAFNHSIGFQMHKQNDLMHTRLELISHHFSTICKRQSEKVDFCFCRFQFHLMTIASRRMCVCALSANLFFFLVHGVWDVRYWRCDCHMIFSIVTTQTMIRLTQLYRNLIHFNCV